MAKTAKADQHSVMLCPPMLTKEVKGKTKPDFAHPKVKYPVYASIKFNGNRLFVRAGDLLSRSMIPARNKGMPAFLSHLIAYSKEHRLCFDLEMVDSNAEHLGGTTSIMNGYDHGVPKSMQVLIFDCISLDDWNHDSRIVDAVFAERYLQLVRHVKKLSKEPGCPKGRYHAVPQRRITGAKEAQAYFEEAVAEGHEGIITAFEDGPYTKYRNSETEAFRLKWKWEETVEARIVGIQQGLKMRKGIARTRNAWDYMESPTKNDKNYEPDDMVGALDIKLEGKNGMETQAMFAPGWNHVIRRALWAHRKDLGKSKVKFPVPGNADQPIGPLIGQLVEVRYIPHGEKKGGRKQSARIVRFRTDK